MSDVETDHQLLRRYVDESSHEAFASLVRRHVALVHSAALRQVRDPHDAEDVTQAVFIALAKNAAGVRREQVIAGWLVTATRHLASNARRQLDRRRRHERRAAEMNPTESIGPNAEELWRAVSPGLDEALDQVGDKSRDAIVLRYFEGKSVREVADALSISEDAAKQRLHRAIERLRGVFSKRGVTVSAGALAAVLAANAVQAAPVGLADAASASAMQFAKYLAMKKGAMSVMAGIKGKVIVGAAAALVIGGTTAVVVQQVVSRDHGAVSAAPAAQPSSGSWKERFQKTYALAPGETIKRVVPPFIPERDAYFNEIDQNSHMSMDTAEDKSISTFVDRGEVSWNSWSMRRPTVEGVIATCTGLPGFKLEIPLKDRLRSAPGDWVMRPDTTVEEKMKALGPILSQPDWKIRFETREAEHDVLIMKGKYTEPQGNEFHAVQLFTDALGANKGSAAGDVHTFSAALGDMLDTEVIDESENPKTPVFWMNHLGPQVPAASVDKLLENVTKQSGLTFKRDKRVTSRWVAVPVEGKK